jgi:hypothetical protein
MKIIGVWTIQFQVRLVICGQKMPYCCHIHIFEFIRFFYRDFWISFYQKPYVEVRKKPSSPLTYFGRKLFFPSRCVLWFARRPEFAWTTSSRQSLIALMHHLEQTKARIRQEQIDRTLRRQNTLRLQRIREERLVRETTHNTAIVTESRVIVSFLVWITERSLHLEGEDRDAI